MRHFLIRPQFAVGILLVGGLLFTAGCSKQRRAVAPSAAATTPASPAKLALAEHLTKIHAKMYGTYWCTYCAHQKDLFASAISRITVVECDPKGEGAQPAVCAEANVASYPTWEVNGKLYRGLRSLEELAVISGYKGSTKF